MAKKETVNIVSGNARVGVQVGGRHCPVNDSSCNVCAGTRRMEARGIKVIKSRF